MKSVAMMRDVGGQQKGRHLSAIIRSLVLIAIVAGVGLRTHWLMTPELVNAGEPEAYVSDEGVVGLMGKHIWEGREHPLFFYGQYYLGSLEAYLVALSRGLLGAGLIAVRFVPYLFSVALIAAVWAAARLAAGPTAGMAALVLVSLPPAYVLAWGLKARGGFIEHMFLSTIILTLLWTAQLRGQRPVVLGALGFVAGLAAWVNQLVGVFLAGAALILWRARLCTRRQVLLTAIAFLIGALPLVVAAAQHPSRMPSKLGRKFMLLNRLSNEERESKPLAHAMATRLAALADGPKKLAVVFGLPEGGGAASQRWLLLGAAPLLLFGAGVVHALRRGRVVGWVAPEGVALGLFLGVVAVGYVSSRYMLVAYPLGVLLVAIWFSSLRGGGRLLAGCLLAATVCFNLLTVSHWAAAAEANGTDELVAGLIRSGCTRGYSAGPMYHVVFQSEEKVILSPLQKNRYPKYDNVVGSARRVCYLYRPDQKEKRQHRRFLSLLDERGVTYRIKSIGGYKVMFDFQPRGALDTNLIQQAREGVQGGQRYSARGGGVS